MCNYNSLKSFLTAETHYERYFGVLARYGHQHNSFNRKDYKSADSRSIPCSCALH